VLKERPGQPEIRGFESFRKAAQDRREQLAPIGISTTSPDTSQMSIAGFQRPRTTRARELLEFRDRPLTMLKLLSRKAAFISLWRPSTPK
jgi:hypothetical protein